MDARRYISVILPLKLEWEPCYYSEEEVNEGSRVRVMFAGKEYVGVVSRTDIQPDIDTGKIRPILSHEESLDDILPEEIELWRRVARYYMCTAGEVYKAAYPLGKVNLEEARALAKEKALKRRMRVIGSIEAKVGRIRERLSVKETAAMKAKDGTRTKAAIINSIGKLQNELERAQEALRIAQDSLKDAEEGIIVHVTPPSESGLTLSEAQEKAYIGIKEGFGSGRPVMLHGVTGSGKTEIYIKLAQEVLRQGRNVLYLVPEIALSRQLEERLFSHFGESLLTFHSAETAVGRINTADVIRQLGKNPDKGSYIVLGTRSSLFLPHRGLGLIIVDEEHDGSYKQDSPAPRYNGRDTALMLFQIHNNGKDGCNIILGSATPSLEELYNCQTGLHVKVDLKERFHGSADTEIEIIDTRAERRKRGMTGNLSRKLTDQMRQTLDMKGQILVLRSRRAWSTAMQCTACGAIEKCPHCNVSLSYHKTGNRLTCHYCSYSRPCEGSCSRCGGELASLGAGTQKIEEELSAMFPDARIARLDSDTSQNKKYETQTIRDFARGEIDILVGTQMIAKGFDFSNLSLVAVIAADSLLGIQDFRADEKALHILEQFKGRCGRRGTKGRFIIQTSQPEHPIYSRLSENDADSFNMQLLQERHDFGFPPYSRIIELTVKDSSRERADRMSVMLAEALRPCLDNITGPYAPVVDRIADRHIRKIRISLHKDRHLSAHKARLKELIMNFSREMKYDGHITVDVDPL